MTAVVILAVNYLSDVLHFEILNSFEAGLASEIASYTLMKSVTVVKTTFIIYNGLFYYLYYFS